MSLFNWFSRRAPAEAAVSAPSNSALTQGDPTVPLVGIERTVQVTSHDGQGPAHPRRTERLERRELLYTVVRECMLRTGVLAATYKFKVLSMDNRGQQYLIMVDLAWQAARDSERLAEIEVAIAQAAKARYGILVTAVYWRMNEHVTAAPNLASIPGDERHTAAMLRVPAATTMARPTHAPAAATPQTSSLQPEDLASLREALAKVGASPRPPKGGETPTWSETVPNASAVDVTTLSATQYGDLR